MTGKVAQNTRPSLSHVQGGSGYETNVNLPQFCSGSVHTLFFNGHMGQFSISNVRRQGCDLVLSTPLIAFVIFQRVLPRYASLHKCVSRKRGPIDKLCTSSTKTS